MESPSGLLADLHATAAGDAEAWERLVVACTPRMRAVAWRVLQDLHLVDDALQEAALALQDGSRRCRATDAPGILAWASGVALRRALTLERAQRRRWRRVRPGLAAVEAAPAVSDGADGLDPEVCDRARRCLAALSTADRALIEWYVAAPDARTHLAQALGIRSGTARVRLHRALRRLAAVARDRGATEWSVAALLAAWQALPVPAATDAWLVRARLARSRPPSPFWKGWPVMAASAAVIATACLCTLVLTHGLGAEEPVGALPARPAPAAAAAPAAGVASPPRTPPRLDLEWAVPSPYAAFMGVEPVDAEDALICSGEYEVACLEKGTGEVRWRRPYKGHCHARGAVWHDSAILWTPTGVGAFALSDGREQWTQTWCGPASNGLTNDADFLVEGNLLIAALRPPSGAVIVANLAAQGAVVWRHDDPGQSSWRPGVSADGTLLVPRWGDALTALDPRTGQMRWQTPLPQLGANPPVAAGPLAFVLTNKDDLGQLVALHLADGSVAWRVTVPQDGRQAGPTRAQTGTTETGTIPTAHVQACGGPLVVQDRLVVGSDTDLLGYDLAGTCHWRVPFPTFGYRTFSADAQGRVWAGGDAGELLVVDPATGTVLRRLALDRDPGIHDHPVHLQDDAGTTRASVGTLSTPLIVGNHVYVSTSGGVTIAWLLDSF